MSYLEEWSDSRPTNRLNRLPFSELHERCTMAAPFPAAMTAKREKTAMRGFQALVRLVVIVTTVAGLLPAESLRGDEIEKKRSVTGPRGRTVEREVKVERRPGSVERNISVDRPAGSYQRDLSIQRGPMGGLQRNLTVQKPGGAVVQREFSAKRDGMSGPRTSMMVPSRPSLLSVPVPFPDPYPVYVGRSPRVNWGLNFGLGAAGVLAPPPPVIVSPAPIVVSPAPIIVEPAPTPTIIVPQPIQVVVDPVAEQIGRLASHHDNSREEAARVLGRQGDPRAIAPLMERLKMDKDADVRRAAAESLGLLSDPSSITILERAAIYDKNQAVRDASLRSIQRLRIVAQRPKQVVEFVAPAEPSHRRVPEVTAPASLPPRTVAPPPRPQPPVDDQLLDDEPTPSSRGRDRLPIPLPPRTHSD